MLQKGKMRFQASFPVQRQILFSDAIIYDYFLPHYVRLKMKMVFSNILDNSYLIATVATKELFRYLMVER